MKITRESIQGVVIPILEAGAVKAIKFFDEKTRIRATRILFHGKIDKRFKSVEIRLTIGRPSYAEREMMRIALKRDEGFLRERSLVVFYPK